MRVWDVTETDREKATAVSEAIGPGANLVVLHERLVDGDKFVSDELAACLLPLLRGRLRAAFRAAGNDDTNDAAVDALLEYFARPDRFDSSRGVPLDRFLLVIARRRLINLLRNAAARARWERNYAASSASVLPDSELTKSRPQNDWAPILRAAVDDSERAALSCWLLEHGEAAIAAALGHTQLTDSSHRIEVKRFKDRVRARLRRCLQGSIR